MQNAQIKVLGALQYRNCSTFPNISTTSFSQITLLSKYLIYKLLIFTPSVSPKTGRSLTRFEMLPMCIRILNLSPSGFEPYSDVFREGRGNFCSLLLSSLTCSLGDNGTLTHTLLNLTLKSVYSNEANYLYLYSCIFLFCV